MNTASIALTILIGLIVVLVLLFIWLIRTFASMKPKEKEMFEQEMSRELNDELAQKAIEEIELRNKVKNITDANTT